MAGAFTYHTAPMSRHGEMSCCICRKPITEGDYRAREREDRYVTAHRACTPTDPVWSARDKRERERQERDDALLAACIAFRGRWAVDELDDLIADLRAATPAPPSTGA